MEEMVMLELRPEVAAFAQLMEKKLRENDHKSHWTNEHPNDLFERLLEEAEELKVAIHTVRWARPMEDRGDIPVFRKVLALGGEAADVANFAMMIADVCGALSP